MACITKLRNQIETSAKKICQINMINLKSLPLTKTNSHMNMFSLLQRLELLLYFYVYCYCVKVSNRLDWYFACCMCARTSFKHICIVGSRLSISCTRLASAVDNTSHFRWKKYWIIKFSPTLYNFYFKSCTFNKTQHKDKSFMHVKYLGAYLKRANSFYGIF